MTGKTDQFYKDANGNGTLDANERIVMADATGHYYELVKSAGNVSYTDAKTAATVAGGHLFTALDNADLEAMRAFIATDNGNGIKLAAQTVGSPDTGQGAFVGLENKTKGTAGGWTWIATDGTQGGTDAKAVPDADPAWYTDGTNPNPAPADVVGAMSAGFGTAKQMPLFSGESSLTSTDLGITHYIVEWEKVADVK